MSVSKTEIDLKGIVHALLFKSVKPMAMADLTGIIRRSLKEMAQEENGTEEAASSIRLKEEEVKAALEELDRSLEDQAVMLQEVAGGFRLVTRPEYSGYVQNLLGQAKPPRLSQPAMETLSIVAYRQPISRSEIEAIRGVAVGGVLETLVDRGIVRVAGRAEVPGRPLIYETTDDFLEHFGLRSLEDLPNRDELQRAKLPEPEVPSDEVQPELLEPDEAGAEDSVQDEKSQEEPEASEQTPDEPIETEAGDTSGSSEEEDLVDESLISIESENHSDVQAQE